MYLSSTELRIRLRNALLAMYFKYVCLLYSKALMVAKVSEVGSLEERANMEGVVTPEVIVVEFSGSVGATNLILLLALRYFSSEMTKDKWPNSVCGERMDMAL